MAWFAIFRTDTGRLVSVGSEVAKTLPPGLSKIALPARPGNNKEWDATTRTFVTSPPPPDPIDRLEDIKTDADFGPVWQSLTAAQRTATRKMLTLLLGDHRFRDPSQPFKLGLVI